MLKISVYKLYINTKDLKYFCRNCFIVNFAAHL